MSFTSRTVGLIAATLLTVPLTQAHAGVPHRIAAAPVGPNLINNGSFLSPGVTREQRLKAFNADTDAPITPWEVTAGEVHIFSEHEVGAGGAQAADLTGGPKATIRQVVHLNDGTRYRLTWQERTESWEGCGEKPAENQKYQVAVTGQRTKTYTPTSSWQPPDPNPLDFTATADDTVVQFISASDNNVAPAHCGAMITRVSLKELRSGNN
ncbi:DUF642 domain-containing protein [Streptomyces sp. NPDC017082]|uniref:DUF642 domain-containing protein n=1 Tax=Streptomyces sp. NPDC017082 TaxID=3364974 RepID=UPI0037B76275